MYAVILAGGSGTRLWPLSRELYPKQLLRLTGNRTLLQETADRLLELTPAERILTVTNRRQRFEVAGQLSEIAPPLAANVFVEPEAKNTAPAIALAAVFIRERDPEALMLVAPSDHLILDRKGFGEAVQRARGAAQEGGLVTFGVTPTRPETGYGYIEALGGREDGGGPFKVKRFVEKPDRDTAESYLSQGGYYWNAGMFLWRAGSFLDEVSRHLPEVDGELEALGRALEEEEAGAVRSGGAALQSVYERLPRISVDHGIMERTGNAHVVPADIGWSDIGSWESLYDISAKDEAENVFQGDVIDIDARGCLVFDDKRLVALVGCRDLAVVSTDDALLVCERTRTQEVGEIVEHLKKRSREEYLAHRTVRRPWGTYTVLEAGERFRIKHLTVKPSGRLSLQMHYHRSEHWVVVSGSARVTVGEETFFMKSGESTYIPLCARHRLENPGAIPLSIIEVQNGDYLGEDDIVRFEDTYGRKDEKAD